MSETEPEDREHAELLALRAENARLTAEHAAMSREVRAVCQDLRDAVDELNAVKKSLPPDKPRAPYERNLDAAQVLQGGEIEEYLRKHLDPLVQMLAGVHRERSLLLLAATWPYARSVELVEDPAEHADWQHMLLVELPTGLAGWRVYAGHLDLFGGVDVGRVSLDAAKVPLATSFDRLAQAHLHYQPPPQQKPAAPEPPALQSMLLEMTARMRYYEELLDGRRTNLGDGTPKWEETHDAVKAKFRAEATAVAAMTYPHFFQQAKDLFVRFALRAFRKLEWAGSFFDGQKPLPCCPACHTLKGYPHEIDCVISAAFSAADGVRDAVGAERQPPGGSR